MAKKTSSYVSTRPISNGYVTHSEAGEHYSEKKPKITVDIPDGGRPGTNSGQQAMSAVKALMSNGGRGPR